MPASPGSGSGGDAGPGGDGGPDAAPTAFSCLGNTTAPSTAASPIKLSGTVIKVNGLGVAQAGGVTIEAHRVVPLSGTTLLATDGPTPASGTWLVDLPPGTAPIDGYLKATIATPGTERPTLRYPAEPWRQTVTDVDVLMTSDAQLNGVIQPKVQTDTTGFFTVKVTDCLDQPLADATVSVVQGSTLVGEVLNAPIVQTVLPGTYLVLNVPVGASSVVNATYQGMTFRARTVPSIAGTTTSVTIRPGF